MDVLAWLWHEVDVLDSSLVGHGVCDFGYDCYNLLARLWLLLNLLAHF